MDQKEAHVEVVVAVEAAVVAGGSQANAADISKRAVSEMVPCARVA